ncbi:MAG: metal ABC transporter permease [Thermoleophilia bacterium]|nr:metal ABC transporter permease [Thermoleophilia bacterium]
MMGPLSLDFMRTAYVVGIVVGIVAPLVGLLLVERRMSLIGDGLGHLSFAGVGLGLVLGVEPVLSALVVTIVGAIVIEWLRSSKLAAGDRALALLFYSGLAGGVVLISSAGQFNASINSYLFGSILTIDDRDLIVTLVLAAVIALVVLVLWRPLTGVAIDEEGAWVTGLPVRALNVLVAVLAAVTVAVSIRTVGVLLIGALMVLPVMAAGPLARSLRTTAALASALGALVAATGLTIAYYNNLAPGGTIVLTAAALYAAVLVRIAMRRA